MKINRYTITPLLQSLSIMVLSLLLAFLFVRELWFCSLFTGMLIFVCIAGIYRYQNQQREAMKKFITAIRFSDFSVTFNKKGKKIDTSLATALEQALATFREKIHHLEEKHLYDQTLLSTIDSGLIILNQQQEIEWCNKAALEELQLKSIHQLSDFQAVEDNLPQLLLHLKPGEIKVVHLKQASQTRTIAFTSILFQIKGKALSLISLKNIHTVLENNEIEAWQKLIRVLTHEIMNSMAPIISLSETLLERNTESAPASVTQQALQAIHRRSKGLLEFVQNYRKLTRIPEPEIAPASIKGLLTDLQKLHSSASLRYTFIFPDPDIQLWIDHTQIEQVLINLIRNAEEACTGIPDPHIIISTHTYADRTCISVRDNGDGIVKEAIDKIFVPFFTTKPGGSGIGLSLCKQIMALHQGNITVNSQPGEGTEFQLVFYNIKNER